MLNPILKGPFNENIKKPENYKIQQTYNKILTVPKGPFNDNIKKPEHSNKISHKLHKYIKSIKQKNKPKKKKSKKADIWLIFNLKTRLNY